MNELKFGHRVIAWDEDKSEAVKGRYIAFDEEYIDTHPHAVLVDGDVNEAIFFNCELDPEADEFLIGDEVEFCNDFERWIKGIYNGYDNVDESHISDMGEYWKHCRYPQKESPKEMITTIDVSDVDRLKLVRNGVLIHEIKIIDNE